MNVMACAGCNMHETEQDKINELNVMQRLSGIWHCTYEKLPEYYLADFYCERDSKVAWVEVRCRTNAKSFYPSVYIDIMKAKKLVEVAELTSTRIFFVVQWADECGFMELHRGALMGQPISYPKRNKPRSDKQKEVPVFELPITEFRTLWSD